MLEPLTSVFAALIASKSDSGFIEGPKTSKELNAIIQTIVNKLKCHFNYEIIQKPEFICHSLIFLCVLIIQRFVFFKALLLIYLLFCIIETLQTPRHCSTYTFIGKN